MRTLSTLLLLMVALLSQPGNTQGSASQPMDILVLLADYSACGGAGAAIGEQQLSQFLFGRDAQKATLESQLRYCSHGKVRFGRTQVVTVRMPASQCQGAPWGTFQPPSSPSALDSNCPSQVEAFLSGLEQQARVQGAPVDAFPHRYAVLDKAQQFGPQCTYSGLASLGAVQGVSRMIITSWQPGLLSVHNWLHEMAHASFNLGHAASLAGPNSPGGEYQPYGDDSSVVGGPNGNVQQQRCHNMAHSVLLGWVQPQRVFQLDQIPNRWIAYPIDHPHETDTHGYQLTHGDQHWFFSYRTRSERWTDVSSRTVSPFANNAGIPSAYAPRMLVHRLPRGAPLEARGQNTELVALLKFGSRYTENTLATPFAVKMVARTGNKPRLLLCRKLAVNDCASSSVFEDAQ